MPNTNQWKNVDIQKWQSWKLIVYLWCLHFICLSHSEIFALHIHKFDSVHNHICLKIVLFVLSDEVPNHFFECRHSLICMLKSNRHDNKVARFDSVPCQKNDFTAENISCLINYKKSAQRANGKLIPDSWILFR